MRRIKKTDHLTALIERLKSVHDHPINRVTAALDFCVEKNYLRLKREGNRVNWEWVDYI